MNQNRLQCSITEMSACVNHLKQEVIASKENWKKHYKSRKNIFGFETSKENRNSCNSFLPYTCHKMAETTAFIHTNAPSLLIARLPPLYLCKVHISGFYIPLNITLRFWDTKKRCVLVIPKLYTACEKLKSKENMAVLINALKSAKIQEIIYNFFRFKASFQYFKLIRHFPCFASKIKAGSVHCHPLPLDSRVDCFIRNSRPLLTNAPPPPPTRAFIYTNKYSKTSKLDFYSVSCCPQNLAYSFIFRSYHV